MAWLSELTWLQIVQMVSGLTTITNSPFARFMLCVLIIALGAWALFKLEGVWWRGAAIVATISCLATVAMASRLGGS